MARSQAEVLAALAEGGPVLHVVVPHQDVIRDHAALHERARHLHLDLIRRALRKQSSSHVCIQSTK